MDLAQFKNQFFHSLARIQLNNAGKSPLPLVTLQTLNACNEIFYREGAAGYFDILSRVEKTREALAKFTGASVEQTAFFPSTAAAISQVALGFRFQPGDEILTWDQEYPSSFYPWKVAAERSGAKLVIAKSKSNLQLSTDEFLLHVTPKTKMIAFSWVQYRSGSVTDIQKVTSFASSRGIFTCADIIQGVGAVPFDFQKSGLDAACGGSHKFMLSPLGIGFLLLKEKHIAELEPTTVGAFTFGTSEDLVSVDRPMRTDIMRFEPGAKNMVDIAGFGSSIHLLQETGIETVHQEIVRLVKKLSDGLEQKDYQINTNRTQQPQTAIINFQPTSKSRLKTLEEVSAKLAEGGVLFAVRPPGLRLSPHAFTHDEDIDRVLNLL
jgi:selenocysteine lyase/cysteine desulfurase